MDTLSDAAFRAYRGLVYDTDGFTRFFRQATPIAEIAGLKIGSRPASRKASDAIEDLRAIPWVFSWAQARVMLPGWYGVGEALAAFADKGLLREMAQGWPLFAATLANMEQVLAKSDMAIAARYAALVEDKALGDAIFGRIGRVAGRARRPAGGHRARPACWSATRRSTPRSACASPIWSRSTCSRSNC